MRQQVFSMQRNLLRSPVGIASMRTALFQLGEDFLTAIVFVVIYMATPSTDSASLGASPAGFIDLAQAD